MSLKECNYFSFEVYTFKTFIHAITLEMCESRVDEVAPLNILQIIHKIIFNNLFSQYVTIVSLCKFIILVKLQNNNLW